MERDQEIKKLTNVLRRVARAAWYSAWQKAESDAAPFCAGQYNRILARLEELEPAVKPLFASLPESASPQVIRMAASELGAYFADEAESERHGHHEHREHREHRGRHEQREYRSRGCRPRVWVGVMPSGRD